METSKLVEMPPKRKRPEKQETPLPSKANPVDEVAKPELPLIWKPFMACKIIPSKRIKYISDDEEDETTALEWNNANKTVTNVPASNNVNEKISWDVSKKIKKFPRRSNIF